MGISTDISMDIPMDIHEKICGYGCGYGWEISYPRQAWKYGRSYNNMLRNKDNHLEKQHFPYTPIQYMNGR